MTNSVKKVKKPSKKAISKKPLKAAWLGQQVKVVGELRSKDREFHGLEWEFIAHQERLLFEFNKSSPLKHPRDKGDAREAIIHTFLQKAGYIPNRYGVSVESTRVFSPSGHSSKEIDILVYDALDGFSLMAQPGGYTAYPTESVYGVIQVKSKLTKEEIRKGLDNIASYKKLTDSRGQRGFGILFAYACDLEWKEIVDAIESYSKNISNTQWCNAVFILNNGMIMHGEENMGTTVNSHLEKIRALQMHGRPDHTGICLLMFYGTLMTLLKERRLPELELEQYLRLPLVAGDYSYSFSHGPFAEMAKCAKHQQYQRRLSAGTIEKIVTAATACEPINVWKATDIAHGKAGDNEEQYRKQPDLVRIYNPDNLPLSKILIFEDQPGKPLAFDDIQCCGMRILVPHYYSVKEQIFEPCPKCKSELDRRNKKIANRAQRT